MISRRKPGPTPCNDIEYKNRLSDNERRQVKHRSSLIYQLNNQLPKLAPWVSFVVRWLCSYVVVKFSTTKLSNYPNYPTKFGCRGFKGSVPPPLWMSTEHRLFAFYIIANWTCQLKNLNFFIYFRATSMRPN
jgi:hypothetical protein